MTVRSSLTNDVTTEAVAVAAYLAASMPTGETVRFQERGVVLTEHYIRLNFKVYPLVEITGVSLGKQALNQSVIFVILGIGLFSAAVTAYLSLVNLAFILLISSGLIALALHFAAPSTHVLRLALPDGEHDALMTRDRAYLMRVAAALTSALAEPQS